MGDLESHCEVIDLIILYGKICIHLARIKDISPNFEFFFLKHHIQRAYDTEKYKPLLAIRLLNLTKSGLPSNVFYSVTVYSNDTIFLLTFSKINSSSNIYCDRYEVH